MVQPVLSYAVDTLRYLSPACKLRTVLLYLPFHTQLLEKMETEKSRHALIHVPKDRFIERILALSSPCRLISACSSVLKHTASFFQTNTVRLASLDLLRSAAQTDGAHGNAKIDRPVGHRSNSPATKSHDREDASACEAYIALEGPVATTSAPPFCSSCLQTETSFPPAPHPRQGHHDKVRSMRFRIQLPTLYAPAASSTLIECRTSTRKRST